MGILGGERLTVDSMNMRLMEASPNPLKDAILYAVLTDLPIVDVMVQTHLNSMVSSMDRFRKYAETSYTLGIPEGMSTTTVVLDAAIVAAAITEDLALPYGAVIDFNMVVPLSAEMAVFPFLIAMRNFDTQYSTITDYPAGMKTMAEYLAFYEHDPKKSIGAFQPVKLHQIALDENESTGVVTALITYKIKMRVATLIESGKFAGDTSYTEHTDYFTEEYILPSALHLGRTYCIATYYVLGETETPSETPAYWFYDVSSKRHPTITEVRDIDTGANFLPVVPIRYENAGIGTETDLYQTGKALLKQIKVEYDTLVEKLEESPDIAEIDHAYVMFGIDLQTEEIESLGYLTEYFDYLHETAILARTDLIKNRITPSTIQVNKYVFDSRNDIISPTGYVVSDYTIEVPTTERDDGYVYVVNNTIASNLAAYGLNTAITFSYIASCIKSGVLPDGTGKVGDASVTKIHRPESTTFHLYQEKQVNAYTDHSSFIFRRQITANTYKEVTVYGLIHHNYVYAARAIRTSLADIIEDPNNHHFIIPLHYSVVKMLPKWDQNALYQQSLFLVINTYKFTNLNWYETGLFKIVTGAIMMYLAVKTGQYWLMNLGKALTLGSAAIFLAKSVIAGIVLNLAMTYIAAKLGPEFAVIAALAAAALGVYLSNSGWSMDLGFTTMPVSSTLLSLSNALISGAQNAIGAIINDIMEQYETFLVTSAEQQRQLDEKKQLLQNPQLLSFDLLEAQQPQFRQIPNESPTAFYDRTIHTGNVGVLVLDVIPVYHSVQLALPEPDYFAV